MKWQNYKELSEGKIEVYGNSCQIYENPFGLSQEEQDKGQYQRMLHHRPNCKPPIRKKGDIKGFSKNSCLRLLKKINKVDYRNREMPFFVTLTYPSKYPEDRVEYKSDIDTMLKRTKREFGDFEYLWRLEAQRRGAPHYHVIIFFDRDVKLEYLRHWVSKNWFEVAQRKWDVKDEKHLRAGTNCQLVKNYRQLMAYVSKYMGKVEVNELHNPGRFWASSRKFGDFIAEIVLNGIQLIQFRRLLKRYVMQTNKRFARIIPSTQNIEVFAYWEFILRALNWVQLTY